MDPFKPVIDEILKADLDAPRKQRHTVTRIWQRLMDEHQIADVSYPVVRAYVAERKPQIRVEAGRGPAEVFVPQSHRPGDEAEVDFGEVVIRLELSRSRVRSARQCKVGFRRRQGPHGAVKVDAGGCIEEHLLQRARQVAVPEQACRGR